MVTSQQIVIGWFEYAAAGAILLIATKLIVSRLRQPIDRQNLILMGLVASAFLPLAVSFSSWSSWHLGLFATAGEQVAVAPLADTTKRSDPKPFPLLASNTLTAPKVPPEQFETNRIPEQRPDHRPDTEQAGVFAAVPATSASDEVPASGSLTANSTETTSANWFSVWWVAAATILASHVLAFGFFIIEWLCGTIRLRNICRAAQAPDSFVWETWTQVSGARGSSVRLLLSTQISAPMVFGCWRPVILIPKSLAQGDRSALRFCLTHEWSHVIGGDLRAWQLANFCQFLLWYQPLFWMLRRELRICQDLIADDRAVGTSEVENRLQYSELLMSIAKQKLNPNIVGAIAFHDRSSQLSRRIKMLLSSSQSLRVRSPQAFLWLSGCLLLAASFMVGSVRLNTAIAEAGLTEQPELAQDGDTKQATDDQKQSEQLVEDVSDGVRLLGRAIRTQRLWAQPLLVSPDGKKMLATDYYGNDLVLIDREQSRVVQSVRFNVGQRLSVVQDVFFSPSGKYWVVALSVYEPADLRVDDFGLADDRPDDWNIARGNYLLIYADGQLIGRPIRVGEPTGSILPLPSVLFSPHERWLVWERDGVVQPFDLQKWQALTKQEDWGGCFFTADDVLTSWTARQSRNLATDQVSDWQPPASVQGTTFDSVSPDGAALVLSAENGGVAFLTLDSQATSTFTTLQDNRPNYSRVGSQRFGGTLSTGGKYFAGRGSVPGSHETSFFVYDVQNRRFALEPTALVSDCCFIGAEEKLLVRMATDAMWHEIELGPESHKQIELLADRYPGSDWIQFADQNRHLVIGQNHNHTWINRQTGNTLSRGSEAARVLKRYPSPWDTSSFEFAQAPATNYAVKQRQVTTGHSRQLYAHISTSDLTEVFLSVFGKNPEFHRVVGLHLACASEKKLLRELRHESRLGFIFRQWDVERQRLDWEKTFKVRTPIVDVMRTADISPDGTRFAVTTNEHLWVVDAAEGQAVAEIELPEIPASVTLNHNGSLVAISYRSDMAGIQRVHLLDVASKTFVHTLAGDWFLEPKFHPTQELMAVVKWEMANQLTIFDTTTWEAIFKHETSTEAALAMTISDDFQFLAMTLNDTRIEVWDLAKLGFTNVKSP